MRRTPLNTGTRMLSYTETTEGISVTVQPLYLEDRSNVMQKEFFFVYFIAIRNDSDAPVQLLRRRWLIQDSGADGYEVEGEGVVGQQPTIQPGGIHHYNSFCILKSFSGSMEGAYRMRRADDETFDIAIPRFYLKAHAN
jgi:ApaG protein